jgi:hypothetical protein
MSKFLPVLVIILAICVVLFVLIPLAYMVMGKIPNPWEIGPTTTYNPAYSSAYAQPGAGTSSGTASTEPDVLKRIFGGAYAKLGSSNRNPICMDPATSLSPHMRDATLRRGGDVNDVNGANQQSIVSSDTYHMSMTLPGAVTDWQYTDGALEDELASFTYDNLIINILARSSVSDCVRTAEKTFGDFHESNQATEYFSSPVYMNQGKPIGLESATLRTSGKGEISGRQYYWYMMDETYAGFENRPVVTIWYSTYVNTALGGTEFWFAFRTYKVYEEDLNKKAEGVLGGVGFE